MTSGSCASLAPRRGSMGSKCGQKPRTKFTEEKIPELRGMLLATIGDRCMRGEIDRRLTHRQPLLAEHRAQAKWGHRPEDVKHLESLIAGYERFLEEKKR